MRKFLFIALLATASVMAYAQPRAIGVRLGSFDGVSYQHGFGESSMLEVEAGFNVGTYWGARINGTRDGVKWHAFGHNVQAAVTYDWIDPFGATFSWSKRGEWHWYLGVGAAGGYGWHTAAHSKDLGDAGVDNNWGWVGGALRAGVEYTFWFPLQLSLDYRPTVGVGLVDTRVDNIMTGCYWDVLSLGLSARYRF